MWEIIITAVVSVVTSGGLVQFINWRASKKKANLDNTDLEVDTLNKVIDTLQESNQHFETVNQQREDKINELRKECNECEADYTLATSYICLRCSCPKRLPLSRGCGKQAIEQLKSGEIEPNYDPVEWNK